MSEQEQPTRQERILAFINDSLSGYNRESVAIAMGTSPATMAKFLSGNGHFVRMTDTEFYANAKKLEKRINSPQLAEAMMRYRNLAMGRDEKFGMVGRQLSKNFDQILGDETPSPVATDVKTTAHEIPASTRRVLDITQEGRALLSARDALMAEIDASGGLDGVAKTTGITRATLSKMLAISGNPPSANIADRAHAGFSRNGDPTSGSIMQFLVNGLRDAWATYQDKYGSVEPSQNVAEHVAFSV